MGAITTDVATKLISTLAGAGALAVVTLFWNKVVLPWWQDLHYSGEEIEGQWNGNAHTPAGDSRQSVEIKRKGYRVYGTIRAIGGAHEGMEYVFEGTYKSLLLTATYVSLKRDRLDRGSFTLMLASGGRILLGGEAAYLTASNDVGWFKYEWTRA
ncbi:MAG TPA: hypothetical protein VGM05_03390 [Planctomycetaceae bacterium]